jgi:hypothetical protein
LAKVAIIDLGSDAEFVGQLRRRIEPHIGYRPTALAGIHGEPVVLVGFDKPLGEEPVDLDGSIADFEFLR